MQEDSSDEQPTEMMLKFADTIVTYCPMWPLVGLISPTQHFVEVYRITFEIEKIVEKVMPNQPSSFQFTKDGLYCAIGFKDGHLGIFKSDTLLEIFMLRPTESDLQHLDFIQLNLSAVSEFGKGMVKELIELEAKPNERLKEQMLILNSPKQSFLYTCDSQSVITAYYNGWFKLLHYTLPSVTKGNTKVLKIKANKTGEMLLVQTSDHDILHLDLKALLVLKKPLSPFFTSLPKMQNLFEFIDRQLEKTKRDWIKFHNGLKMQFQAIQPKLKRDLAEEIGDMAHRGNLSPEIATWIKDDLTNTTILTKLAENCSEQLKVVQEHIVDRLSPATQSVFYLATQLRALLQSKQMMGSNNKSITTFGFSFDDLQDLIQTVAKLSNLFEVLLFDVIEARRETRGVLRYLNNACISLWSSEGDVENRTTELGKESNLVNLQEVQKWLQRGQKNLLLMHININFEPQSAVDEQQGRICCKELSRRCQVLIQKLCDQPAKMTNKLVKPCQMFAFDQVLDMQCLYNDKVALVAVKNGKTYVLAFGNNSAQTIVMNYMQIPSVLSNACFEYTETGTLKIIVGYQDSISHIKVSFLESEVPQSQFEVWLMSCNESNLQVETRSIGGNVSKIWARCSEAGEGMFCTVLDQSKICFFDTEEFFKQKNEEFNEGDQMEGVVFM